ncbi:MAG TPA: DoxX family membrane protein [Candidatus Parasutterella gallistercoris]|jgi:putative doxX|nr:DoxX family membrane protein [Candidatus Parasutterella gallistercoris]
MASLLFRWAIALAMLPYGVQKLFHPENATKFPKVFFFSPRVGYYSAAIIETFVPLFLMAGFLTRLAVIPAIVSFTIATKVTIGKDLTSPALPYLFGLIAIFIVGSGLYSADYWLLYILAGH